MVVGNDEVETEPTGGFGGGEGPSVDVAVAVGSAIVVARITRKSVGALSLAPGKPVYALVKSVAIDRHSVGYA